MQKVSLEYIYLLWKPTGACKIVCDDSPLGLGGIDLCVKKGVGGVGTWSVKEAVGEEAGA